MALMDDHALRPPRSRLVITAQHPDTRPLRINARRSRLVITASGTARAAKVIPLKSIVDGALNICTAAGRRARMLSPKP